MVAYRVPELDFRLTPVFFVGPSGYTILYMGGSPGRIYFDIQVNRSVLAIN